MNYFIAHVDDDLFVFSKKKQQRKNTKNFPEKRKTSFAAFSAGVLLACSSEGICLFALLLW